MSVEVPEGWRTAKLGEVAVLSGGTTPSRLNNAYWSEGTVPWATPSDITSLPFGQTRIDTTEGHIAEVALKECSLKLNPPGTVLMTSRATIGYAVINDVPMATNQGFLNFACSDDCDPEFLCQWLNSNRGMLTAAAGGSTFKELSRGTAKLLLMPLPPLDEQQRIAEVLRSVNEVIGHLQKSCAAYNRLRRAEVEGFAQASLEHGSRPLESLIAGMDSGWSPDCEGEPARGDEWGVLKTTAVIWDGFDDHHNKRLPANLPPRPALAVAQDDILITRAGPAERTGVVAIVKSTSGKRMLSDKLIRIRAANDLIEPLALNELLRSEVVQDQFRALKSGMAASQTNISQKALRGVAIPNASREEQRAFVRKMTNLDAALDGERQALATVRDLNKLISTELLSGRVRVPA